MRLISTSNKLKQRLGYWFLFFHLLYYYNALKLENAAIIFRKRIYKTRVLLKNYSSIHENLNI